MKAATAALIRPPAFPRIKLVLHQTWSYLHPHHRSQCLLITHRLKHWNSILFAFSLFAPPLFAVTSYFKFIIIFINIQVLAEHRSAMWKKIHFLKNSQIPLNLTSLKKTRALFLWHTAEGKTMRSMLSTTYLRYWAEDSCFSQSCSNPAVHLHVHTVLQRLQQLSFIKQISTKFSDLKKNKWSKSNFLSQSKLWIKFQDLV